VSSAVVIGKCFRFSVKVRQERLCCAERESLLGHTLLGAKQTIQKEQSEVHTVAKNVPGFLLHQICSSTTLQARRTAIEKMGRGCKHQKMVGLKYSSGRRDQTLTEL